MAANTAPIFPLTPKAAWGTLTAANTAKDGTGTVLTLAAAGAAGAYFEAIRALPLGTNVASVLRIFFNNGNSNAVAANNTLVYELSLPTTTLTEVAQQDAQIILGQITLPAGYKLLATIGTTVAAGWSVAAIAGDY